MQVDRIRNKMEEESIDALILTEEANIAYVLGEKASGYVFITQDSIKIIASKFYQHSLQGFDVSYAYSREDFQELLKEEEENLNGEVRADSVSESLKEKFVVEQTNVVEEARKVKTPEEIEKIREACEITSKNMENLRDRLFDGITEWQAVSNITEFYADRGVGSSFVTDEGYDLVHRNCLRPHRDPKNKEVKDDDLVIVDTGCRKGLYCSDVTRTYCENPSRRQRELFEDVKEIQAEVIDMIEPGVEIAELDHRMNALVEEKGYEVDENVLHLLGHSIGIEVHEKPSIQSKSDEKLRENMVLAIEPAIYVEDIGGVRIEDTVLVTESGAERLSNPQIEL